MFRVEAHGRTGAFIEALGCVWKRADVMKSTRLVLIHRWVQAYENRQNE